MVLTREEVRAVLQRLNGVPRLMASMLYGSGLRLLECCRLRVQDVDLATNQIVVRGAKGDKDRVTVLPAVIKPDLARHLDRGRAQHQRDLQSGAGWVDIDVNVNGAAVPPTDLPTNAFCFETGVNDEVRHTASYTVAVEDLPAGSHSIQVIADNQSLTGGIVGFPILSDVSLVVTVHEN